MIWSWFRRKPAAASDADADTDTDTDAEGDDGDALDETAPPLRDELDLHTFQPRDCADLVAEYVLAAQEAGFATVRIIHGKGTGTLRRIVHGVLEKHPAVKSFALADQRSGSWGATLAELHPRPPADAAAPGREDDP